MTLNVIPAQAGISMNLIPSFPPEAPARQLAGGDPPRAGAGMTV